jgi:MFS family permease
VSPAQSTDNPSPASEGAAQAGPPITPPPAPAVVQEPMPGTASTSPEPGALAEEVTREGEGQNRGRFAVLRHRHYRHVVGAQFVSNCGNWMEAIGLQMYVATITESIEWLGYLGAAQLAPILLLGTLGGLVADRVDRRRMLMVTQTLLMLVAVGVLAVSLKPWPSGDLRPVYLMLVLGALQGVVMAFNMPAWQVLTPRLVPKPEIIQAITLNGIQFNLARVVGPALAGLIMSTAGIPVLFAVNAASFLVVVLTVRTTPANPPPAHDGKHPWRQVLDAAGFIFGNRGPLALFWAQVVMSMLAAPLVRFLSMFVLDVYRYNKHDADRTVGYMLAVQGVGAVVGGLTLRWLPNWYPRHHLIPIAILANGLFISFYALAVNPAVGYPLMFVIGFFWIWAFNQSWAAMQQLAPDAMRGRVLALTVVASFGSTAIGTFLAGKLGERLNGATLPIWGEVTKAASTQAALLVLSLPLIAAGAVMLLFRTPEVDGLPRRNGLTLSDRLSLRNALFAREHRPVTSADSSDPAAR